MPSPARTIVPAARFDGVISGTTGGNGRQRRNPNPPLLSGKTVLSDLGKTDDNAVARFQAGRLEPLKKGFIKHEPDLRNLKFYPGFNVSIVVFCDDWCIIASRKLF